MKPLSPTLRKEAVTSLEQFCDEQFDEPVGNLAVEALFDFMVAELGPLFYNQGVKDAQARIQGVITDLDQEVYQEPFTYWRRKR
ncbi:DUF2164 domain-containing protein [Aquidulcibacter sp.]|jgi:uncharacterized protein (DUF2164 family)|uniref:DUF2164 domain-containing protein n=1 Tax=Aquidulcibacter sp. TaxID=2052990 RepID=UPI0022C0B8A6|nr:DUF2164 domain-containing protein [Aquidulcibacter sp.]MCE2890830.1 DUF2164 domain-containing protein [Hyphomonadaceae bacterium]MCZ8210022.1 DUF2164 domain-containing protein [Aquidulcibacter sp.]